MGRDSREGPKRHQGPPGGEVWRFLDRPGMLARMTLIVVKRSEQEFHDWLSTETGWLESFAKYSDVDLKLEGYQRAFLSTPTRFRCTEKSRQVGYSFVFACEALARSHLRQTYNAIFVSYNLSDAKEKISYVQQMHEELPLEYQKKRVTDSKLETAFKSNEASAKISRIISNPSKAPRGKTGDIYLDELAHCANDVEIYKGSTALILRSHGQLTVCSSPLGRRGQFWEIARQELEPYKTFWRQNVPWWLNASHFCRDVPGAAKYARSMSTHARVERFGTQMIQDQLDSMTLEGFQQEYEVAYSDDTMSFFPYELILSCTDPTMELAKDFHKIKAKGRLTAGVDIGRVKDLSVLTIFEEVGDKKICRMIKKYKRVPFHEQERDFRAALQALNIVRFSIDNSSIGMQMAENLQIDYPQVVRETFSNQSKELWVTDFKIQLQRESIRLPSDRELVAEIRSIKKSVSAAGRVLFQSGRTSKGHADTFWAIVLACRKEREIKEEPMEIGVTIIG